MSKIILRQLSAGSLAITANDRAVDETINLDDLALTSVTYTQTEVDTLLSDQKTVIEAQIIGVNQTWQLSESTDTGAIFTDGTPSYRTSATNYTNNTGKPIQISITCRNNISTSNNHWTITVDGIVMARNKTNGDASGGNAYNATLSAIVPAGSVYSRQDVSGSVLDDWAELR